jgi:hypothetical protein
MFCAPRFIFGGTEGVGSLFHVLRSMTHFRRCRVRQVPFSCFALPDSFSAVSSVSGPVFMFSALELIFDGTEGVGSCFHVLRSETLFRRFRVRRVPFSCFALPKLILGNTEDVGSRFLVFYARTSFRQYRGRRVPFSCFALPNSFSAVPRASSSFFKFCAPGLILGGTEGVGSRFHVFRSRTRFRR